MTTDKSQRSTEIKALLLEEIHKAADAGQDRLMPEVELAENLRISRQLLRDCLSSLEQEGFVSRVHGVGTILNKHVIAAEHRLDLEKESLPTLRDAGLKAKVTDVRISTGKADSETAEKLCLPEGSDVVTVATTVSADGVPAIYCVDVFSQALCPNGAIGKEKIRGSVFEYLRDECGLTLQMDIAELKVLKCGSELSGIFALREDDVLLATFETGYDFFGTPLVRSKVYYRPGIMKHTVVRKKIG